MKPSSLVAAVVGFAAALTMAAPCRVFAQSPTPAVPRPFPNSGGPRPAAPGPSTPAGPPAPAAPAPTAPESPIASAPAKPAAAEQLPAGTPIYPTAEFIDSYDAGAGQRYYLYGTNAAYNDILAYYRTILKNGGRELFRIPPAQQFDLGRFDNDTMAYPPSVVVKDYTWNSSPGYLAVSGTTEKRYKTIIQIVPPAPGR